MNLARFWQLMVNITRRRTARSKVSRLEFADLITLEVHWVVDSDCK